MCLPPMNTCGTEVRPVIARTEVVEASLPNMISSYGKPFTSNNAFAFEQNGQPGLVMIDTDGFASQDGFKYLIIVFLWFDEHFFNYAVVHEHRITP